LPEENLFLKENFPGFPKYQIKNKGMAEEIHKKRLLLVNPVSRYRKGFASDLTSKHPPLCLAIIAALTGPEWKIRIVDENFQNYRFREADLVGITSFTSSAPRAYEIAREFREKGIPVVMGGIHASMCPEEALQYVDTVVIGEAESVWPEVLKDYSSGVLKKIYKGKLLEMKNQPKPRHDLFHPKYVFNSIQTSRGCPMDCDFCSVTAFNGNQYRLRPVPEVLDELELLRGSGRAVFFVDDNIVGHGVKHRERAKELFRGIIERNLRIDWFSQASLDVADDEEVLELAARSGCQMLLIGIESELEEGLRSTNKKLNISKGVENYREIFKKINRHGIGIIGTFIFGLESDKPGDLFRRGRYIIRSKVDCIQTSILTPLPGTTLYNRLAGSGSLQCTDYPDNWKYYHFMDLVFHHPAIPSKEFREEILRTWKMLYRPYRLILLFLKTWFRTRKLKPALWSYQSNLHYRNIVFERNLHTCDK
jgi:radical SAM superfamily enzyme YgiQ (UPF0313 family)